MLQPSTAETKLFERRTRAHMVKLSSLPSGPRGVDVRVKPVPTFPSRLQDAPSELRSSSLLPSILVLLVLRSPFYKNVATIRFSHLTLSEASLSEFVAVAKGSHPE